MILGARLPAWPLRQPKRGFREFPPHWFRGSLHSFLWDHLSVLELWFRECEQPRLAPARENVDS
jgi:hypothetical protein